MSPDRLRVVTYNTRDFLDDRHAAARVVRTLDPDVLCLQEVPRRFLSRWRLGGFARACSLEPTGSHRGSGGVTILVRPGLPVSSATHHPLPVRLLMRTRGYAVATVSVPGSAPLTVVSVHLSLDPDERHRHARAILDAVGPGDGEVVVAGDLNEGESGAAFQAFADPLRLVPPPHPTYPAATPRHTLDVVFVSPGVTVLPHDPVALPLDDVVRASDHRPTWVDLELATR